MISVVIPVYNTPDFKLLRAKESLDRQTHRDFEAIWIDDGSKKETASFLDAFANEHHRVLHYQNGGLFQARVRGYKEAKGDYLFFLDSDDYLEPETLEDLYQEAKRTGASMVIGSFFTEVEGKKGDPWFFRGKNELMDADETVLRHFQDAKIRSFVWGRLYSKALLDQISPFPYPNRLFEDVAFTLAAGMAAGKTAYLSKPYYHYMVGDKTTLTGKPNPRRLDDHLFAYLYMRDYIAKNGTEKHWRIFRRSVLRMKANLWYDQRVAIKGGLPKEEAKTLMKKANQLKIKPKTIK